MKVLDIGCGWGGSACHMAKTCGVHVVGGTISKEQAAMGQQRAAGLDVDIRLQDCRAINETLDAIYSIGMFEHVGQRNYETYIKTALACLNPRGSFLLHTIGDHKAGRYLDPLVDRYIFPNGHLPSGREILNAAEPYFTVEDWHSFGPDYDKTVMAWIENFEAS
jgi:cyclopropane-fatty-acyl-phospholipid synthase